MADLQQPNTVGVREDLSDILIELEAQDTPAFSLIPKGEKPNAPVMQFPVSGPGFVSRKGVRNGTPVGGATDLRKKYALLESENHWVRGEIKVGKKDAKTVDRAGIGMGNLYSDQVTEGLLALKTSIDCITLDNFDQKPEGVEGSETRGAFSWASPTPQKDRPVPDWVRPKAAQFVTNSFSDFTPDLLKSALNARWANTKRKSRLVCFCGDMFKDAVSSWSMYLPEKQGLSTVRDFTQNVAAGKKERVLSQIIDILEFDTATVELHLEPNLLRDRYAEEDEDEMPMVGRQGAIMFPQESMSYHFAEDVTHEELPYDGGNERGQVTTIFHTMARPFDMVAFMPAQ